MSMYNHAYICIHITLTYMYIVYCWQPTECHPWLYTRAAKERQQAPAGARCGPEIS